MHHNFEHFREITANDRNNTSETAVLDLVRQQSSEESSSVRSNEHLSHRQEDHLEVPPIMTKIEKHISKEKTDEWIKLHDENLSKLKEHRDSLRNFNVYLSSVKVKSLEELVVNRIKYAKANKEEFSNSDIRKVYHDLGCTLNIYEKHKETAASKLTDAFNYISHCVIQHESRLYLEGDVVYNKEYQLYEEYFDFYKKRLSQFYTPWSEVVERWAEHYKQIKGKRFNMYSFSLRSFDSTIEDSDYKHKILPRLIPDSKKRLEFFEWES